MHHTLYWTTYRFAPLLIHKVGSDCEAPPSHDVGYSDYLESLIAQGFSLCQVCMKTELLERLSADT